MKLYRRVCQLLTPQQKRVRGRIHSHKEGDSGAIKTQSEGFVSVSAVVTRADGTVENLGEISRGKV